MSSSLPDAFGRAPTHFILRIARGEKLASRTLSSFTSSVRRSLNTNLIDSKRLAIARQILDEMCEVGLDTPSVQRFKAEWLTLMCKTVSDVVLLAHLAEAELEAAGMTLTRGWSFEDRRTDSAVVPRVNAPEDNRVGLLMTQPVLRSATGAWRKIVLLTAAAVESGDVQLWDEDHCLAAIQGVSLLSTAGTPVDLTDTPAGAEPFFCKAGAELWASLAARLSQLRPVGARSIWSREMQTLIKLAVKGQTPQILPCAGEATDASGSDRVQPGRQVVIEPIPPAAERTDRESLKQYEALRTPRPVRPMPTHQVLRSRLGQLEQEFPWAQQACRGMQNLLLAPSLLGATELSMKPVLLVGPPGAGKSRLARRFSELFELTFLSIPCAGAHDGKVLVGTSRGWSTGEPSPILGTLLRHQTASAFVLLDEIDKMSSTQSNAPAMTAALLGLLEPETSSRWRDAFLQANCDLSRVIFWATANSLSGLPRALLSRFELVYVPEPGAGHITVLAMSMVADLERDWGLPPGVLPIPDVGLLESSAPNARQLKGALVRWLSGWVETHLHPSRLH